MALISGEQSEIRNSYQYDAFGVQFEAAEQSHNRIRYTGQQYDELTGQHYLRARFYKPVLVRFIQDDTYWGDGLNLYAYCYNNPVMYYDPSRYQKEKSCVQTNQGENGTTDSSSSSRKVTNSAGQEVIRDYVKDQDELLEEAEKAAGGSLDDFIELKKNWYQNEEGTIKIEWNPESHVYPSEGPHVTVRVRNERGAWSVIKKIFIEGWDHYKKT